MFPIWFIFAVIVAFVFGTLVMSEISKGKENNSDQRIEKEIVTSKGTHLAVDSEGDIKLWDEDSNFYLLNEELAEVIAFLSAIPVRKK